MLLPSFLTQRGPVTASLSLVLCVCAMQITLLEQNHMVEEGNPKISDLLAKVGEEVGAKVELVDFIRYKTGDA